MDSTPTKKINFIRGKYHTRAYLKLEEAKVNGGAEVTKRGKGFSDWRDVIQPLVKAGYLEPRQTGPRGGTRYHLTRRGHYALRKYAEV